MGYEFTVSRNRAILIIALFVIIIVLVGLMAGLIRAPCPQASTGATTTVSSATTTATTAGPTPTQEPTGPEPYYNPFLPNYTEPLHYDLYVYPDFYYDAAIFYGREDVYIRVKEEAEYIIIHIKYMNVTQTTLRNNATRATIAIDETFHYERNQYWVTRAQSKIPAGTVVVLHLEFNGRLDNGIVGYYKSTYINQDTGIKSWLATTKFQPTDARKAFPNFDEPKYKATFTITQRHWSNFTALSNMPVETTMVTEPGWNETRHQKTVSMSSYLVAFIVCDFDYTENVLDSGKPHRIWASPDKRNQTWYAVEQGLIQQNWFAREFNMTFHLPKLDQAAIPDYPSGATEHWGLITYRESRLLYDETAASASSKQGTASIIGHELAHNFFGNLVTCAWWDDIWLNEGYASFYEEFSVNVSEPDWDMLEYAGGTVNSIMGTDALSTSRPLVIEVNHPDSINSVFDGITYSKGSSVLLMMRAFLGPDDFLACVRHYLKKREYSTATTQQMWADFNEVVGHKLNIKTVMDPWVFQMGFPVIDVSVTMNAGNAEVRATQKRFMANPDDDLTQPPSQYEYKWYVPLTYTTESGAEGLVWMNRSESLDFTINSSGSWIKLNRRQHCYFRVNYDKPMWTSLANQLLNGHTVFTVSDRAHLVRDAFALAGAQQLDFPTALNLTRYLKDEDHYVAWSATAGAVGGVSNYLFGRSHYDKCRKYLRDMSAPIMDRLGVRDTGTHLEKLLRSTVISVACGNGNSVCLQNITELFTKWLENDTVNALSPNLRALVYRIGMEATGGETEWDIMWERYLVESSALQRSYLMRGLASIRTAWILQRYLDRATDTRYVREQDFFTVVSYVSATDVGIRVAWDWVREHYDQLLARFTTSNRSFGRMVPNMVARFKNKFRLDQVEAHFAKYPDAGTGTRARQQALSSIRNNIAWLERNEQVINDWLDANVR